MDIPQDISEKIASYIRRPYKYEDIKIMTSFFEPGDPRNIMSLATFLKLVRQTGLMDDDITRFIRACRRAWSLGGWGEARSYFQATLK